MKMLQGQLRMLQKLVTGTLIPPRHTRMKAMGLFIGKPMGIILMTWMMVIIKIAHLPAKTGWMHIAGIGFTMSIFIAMLSFEDASVQGQVKFAVLVGSTICRLAGYFILRQAIRRN
jgi:Na+/H+ antiporter NhaA